VAALPVLAVLLPPETRGEAAPAVAGLAALLALSCWGRIAAAGHAGLVLAALLLLPASLTASSPAASVEPVSLALLAVALGLAGAASRDHARAARLALCIAAGVVSLHALYQRLGGLSRLAALVRLDATLPDRDVLLAKLEGGRAFASFQTPAALGGFLALTLPLAAGEALASTGRRRLAWGALAVLECAALVASASATAAGALLCAVGLWAARYPARARTRVAIVAALAAVLLAVAVQRQGIALRPGEPGGPWRLRQGNFRAAWAMAADHPWRGVGPGGFAEEYPRYRRAGDNETRHAHCLPLELAAELGWPAGAALGGLWLVVFVAPLALGRRRGPAGAEAAAVGLASFGLHNLVDFTAFMPSLLWPAALLRGSSAMREPAGAPRRPPAWLAAASAVLLVGAAGAAGLSGRADSARRDARELAFAGRLDAAGAEAARACGLAAWDADARLLRARLTLDAARAGSGPSLAEAVVRADEAVAVAPARPAAREVRALARGLSGDLPGAFADLSVAARLYPLREDYARSRERIRGLLDAAERGAP